MRARVLPLLLLLGLAGCSHYRLGTEGQLAFTTLYIAPVENKILLPQTQAILTTELRSEFSKDGRVTLVNSPQAADATLKVTIVRYEREVAAPREQDTGLASKFILVLGADCTLRDTRTGRAFFENRTVTAQRGAFTDSGQPSSPLTGDQLQSEYNTMPLLAQALSGKITHTVLDVW